MLHPAAAAGITQSSLSAIILQPSAGYVSVTEHDKVSLFTHVHSAFLSLLHSQFWNVLYLNIVK